MTTVCLLLGLAHWGAGDGQSLADYAVTQAKAGESLDLVRFHETAPTYSEPQCPSGTRPEPTGYGFVNGAACARPNGRWHGPYIIGWPESGKVVHRGEYRRSRKTGLWCSWDMHSKEFRSEFHYRRGCPDGWAVERRNGVIFVSKLKMGKPSKGLHAMWSDETGRLLERGQSTLRGSQGPWDFWHDNGARAAAGSFVNGKKRGVWTYWHDNGQMSATGSYKNGRVVGRWQAWSPTGEALSAPKEDPGDYWEGILPYENYGVDECQ